MAVAPHAGLWVSPEGEVFFENVPVARLIPDALSSSVHAFRDFAARMGEEDDLRAEIARLERELEEAHDQITDLKDDLYNARDWKD
jgi:hypothetical protein